MIKISNRSLVKYHRWMGLFTIVFIVIFAITGLLLQHTDSFGFGHKHLRQGWLLSWYNSPSPAIQSINLKSLNVIQVDNSLLVNQKIIGESHGKLWGASQTSETMLIGSGTTLYWLTSEGELIDTLKSPVNNPIGLTSIRQQYQLKTKQGWLAFNDELEEWYNIESIDVSLPQVKQANINEVILPDEIPVGISVERLLQDLHSGRFFGPFGILIMDLASIALVFLAMTGAWVWLRKR